MQLLDPWSPSVRYAQDPACLLLLSLLVYACALLAQTTNASVTGRVLDPSKAALPDARVAAVNTGTNFRYESTTDGAGEYTLANLPPGTYQLEVEKSEFKKLIRPGVILHATNEARASGGLGLVNMRERAHQPRDAIEVESSRARIGTRAKNDFADRLLQPYPLARTMASLEGSCVEVLLSRRTD